MRGKLAFSIDHCPLMVLARAKYGLLMLPLFCISVNHNGNVILNDIINVFISECNIVLSLA